MVKHCPAAVDAEPRTNGAVIAQFNEDNAESRAEIALQARLAEERRIAVRKQAAERKRQADVNAEVERKRAAVAQPKVERTAQAPATQGTTSVNFEATAYTAFCSTGCTGVTATGLNVANTIYAPSGRRIVAVDPVVVPLGSVVLVTLANGQSFEAQAEDTGGAIKGNRIDILVATHAEAVNFGRQAVKITRK